MADTLVIFPIIGVNAFEPHEQTAGPQRLYLEGPNASGTGAESEDGFVVFAGALARTQTVESMPGWAANLRASLIESNALVLNEDGSSLRLTSDYVFRSPSAAAATLLGRSAAGPIEWKDEAGTTLKELRERAVEASED